MSFPLIVMAAPRPAPNWHSCIASAVLAGFEGPIVVIYDGIVSANERALYEHLAVSFSYGSYSFHLDEGATPRMRALRNAIRCFRYAAGHPFAVVVEDDVTFADGWEARLNGWRDCSGDPVFLGYCREAMPAGLRVDTVGDVLERDEQWDATLFVGLSGKRAREAAEALETSLAVQPQMPADNALSLHWRNSRTRRLTMNPSVVQHLGDVALVNPRDGIRRAPSFTGRA